MEQTKKKTSLFIPLKKNFFKYFGGQNKVNSII